MITPEDIQTIEFGKSVRGYKEEDVDQFLDDLTLDYEAVLKENEQLKAELSALQDKYKEQEESIYYTLQSAKQLMSDISTSAERRAEILLKNAQLDADNLTRQTRSSLAYLQEQEAVLKNRVFKLKSKIKNILEAELEDINTIELDLFHEETPDTVDKLMSYSAEFDGFFGAEEISAEPEDNRKTLIVAAPLKEYAKKEETAEEQVIQSVPEEASAAEEPEEVVLHTVEDLMKTAEETVEESAADIFETAEEAAEETTEAAEEIQEAVCEAVEDVQEEAENGKDIVFNLSDDAISEEE